MAFLNPRYNGRVGVYRINEIEKFEIISYTSSTWVSSWGVTPSVWYDASMSDFFTNKVDPGTADLFSTSIGVATYSNTLNSLPVLSNSNAAQTLSLYASHSSGSYNTTHFIVGYSTNIPVYVYNYSSLGGTQSRGQVVTQINAGGGLMVTNTMWSNNPISALYQTSKSYSTTNTWYVSVVSSTHSGASLANLKNDSKHNGDIATDYTLYGSSIYPVPSGYSDSNSRHIVQVGSSVTGVKLAEVLTYYRILSSSESLDIETYLKAKWGITY
jgi:hypothetical protein